MTAFERSAVWLALQALLACSLMVDDELDANGVRESGAGASAGAAQGSGPTGSGTGGSIKCGDAPPATAACPGLPCNGGCAGGICRVECEGDDACKDAQLACPPGLGCAITCSGDASCKAATITCPAAESCELSCYGHDACTDATLVGALGPLGVECGKGSACAKLAVHCGSNSCEARCSDDGAEPDVSCGSACACEDCRESD
jgi:hypothetical protein